MQSNFKKFNSFNKANIIIASLFIGTALINTPIYAVTSQVHGQAAVVGEYINGMQPGDQVYQGWRVPIGLMLEAKPSETLGVYIDFNYAFNNYPYLANSLGNTSAFKSNTPNEGTEFNQPYTRIGGRGEKPDNLTVTQAYLEIVNDKFMFRAGRIPRNWGLGIWKNAEWKPEGGSISTSDALMVTADFMDNLITNFYWEKISEGKFTSLSDDADAISVELVKSDNPADSGTSGVSRQVGIAVQKYKHAKTNTSIDTLDIFGRFFIGASLIEGELLYPNGSTRSPQYQELGGNPSCITPGAAEYRTCDSQKIEMFASVVNFKFEFDSRLGLAASEDSRVRFPTFKRNDTHTMGASFGYVSGDADSYSPSYVVNNRIKAATLHPNFSPALLMYSSSAESYSGMPGAMLTNTMFIRSEYMYENSKFGSFTPAFIAGWLTAPNTSSDESQLGRNSSLGYELDFSYSYVTADSINYSIDSGIWVAGNAWNSTVFGKPTASFGLRAMVSTKF